LLKKAFTLMELVFVILIVGILSALIAPNFSDEKSQLIQAAKQIVSDIRYTQHLALVDDKFDPTDQDWYKTRWQVIFQKSSNSSGKDTDDEWAYTIFSDTAGTHTGNPDISEMAVNPKNPNKLLSGGFSSALDWEDKRATKLLNIGKSYGIKDVRFSRSCSSNNSKRVAFDYLGRPLYRNIKNLSRPYGSSGANYLIQSQCIIKLCYDNPCGADPDRVISIAIEPETGYTHIL
jgi:prepilin-type N-terminal cleavage/methylation domain-containing protein